MATTSLIINSTAVGGKNLQKTVTDVNPYATNEECAQFAHKLVELTTNTYGSTHRVNKINCDTEPSKIKPTLSISRDSISFASDFWETNGLVLNSPEIEFEYNGDGEIFASSKFPVFVAVNKDAQRTTCSISKLSGYAVAPHVITFVAKETDNYLESNVVTLTITA